MDLKESKQLIAEYLSGSPEDKNLKKKLAKKYKISSKMVTSIVNGFPQTNTEIEKTMFEIPLAIEQKRIFDLKCALFNFFELAILDGSKEKKRHHTAAFLLPIMVEIDKIQRLNNNTATSITEEHSKNTKINIADILKELNTPEEKKAFLLKGMLTKKK